MGEGIDRGLIVPSKEKKKEKKSSLIRKLGRSKSGRILSQSQNAPGLVGLLETMRVQMEIFPVCSIRPESSTQASFYVGIVYH
ncbi:protein unc-13 homolog [Cajanus cajan]|uniref:protein unc-13 homolog n=1 Tax=Cajanus cajan TaxID=3821 RepID=UPI0010FBB724|nr:protein unc-13 homolog [Cajanus cajan]